MAPAISTTTPPTFNQFLRGIEAPVDHESLQRLGKHFNKPVSKTSRVPLDRIDEAVALFHRNGSTPDAAPAPSVTDVLAQATQAATPPSPPPASATTAGALLKSYVAEGLRGITLEDLVKWVPEAQGDAPKLVRASIVAPAHETLLRDILDVLKAIAEQLKQDEAALRSWTPPKVQDLTGNVYRYPGVCGHEVETTRVSFEKKFSGRNARQTPLARFCPNCLAMRIALLGLLPGGAQADSLCTFCKDPMFASGQHGYILSRSDIWENLVSGIYRVRDLPRRLRPRHGDTYAKHAEKSAKIKEFQDWRAVFDREVGIGRALVPGDAKKLMAAAQEVIKQRAVEDGLDLDSMTNNYTEGGTYA